MEHFKINSIKENEFLVYTDWLTRFNNPFENLSRVVDKIVCQNCIEPKFNIHKINSISFDEKFYIAKYIWDLSLKSLKTENDYTGTKLDDFLLYEELQTFNEEYLIKYINSMEYQQSVVSYKQTRQKYTLPLDFLVSYFENTKEKPYFLKRLIQKKNSVLSNEKLFNSIDEYASIKLLFLVEGITEEKLFPAFADVTGFNFDKYGIKLKAAGGKTQILKYYAKIRHLLKIPVFILMDADGIDILEDLKKILNPKDSFYLIKEGEIEDIIPAQLIAKTLNNFYANQSQVTEDDLKNNNQPMTKTLYELYKNKGFGEFHKAKFAQILQENISSVSDVSREIATILDIININYKN